MRRAAMAALMLAVCGCSDGVPAAGNEMLLTEATAVPMPPVKPSGRASNAGALCGDARLVGTRTFDLKRPIRACGVGNAVKVTSISGIKLTTPAVLSCKTATTFADWLTETANPLAQKTLGGSIEKVWMMGAYSCRTRNRQRGARLSEHAYGRAIDVGGMVIVDSYFKEGVLVATSIAGITLDHHVFIPLVP